MAIIDTLWSPAVSTTSLEYGIISGLSPPPSLVIDRCAADSVILLLAMGKQVADSLLSDVEVWRQRTSTFQH